MFTTMDKNLNENGIGTHQSDYQSDYQSDNKENQIRIFELILSFSNAQALTLQKTILLFLGYLDSYMAT